jgi:hypothetical protein
MVRNIVKETWGHNLRVRRIETIGSNVENSKVYYLNYKATICLPSPLSLQLGIEISGKTMGARCLMGM